MNKNGIISFGEVIVDMISQDKTNKNFQPFLGGATVNLAVGVKRLGVKSYYLCKIGMDETSVFVEKAFKKEEVCLDYCVRSSTKKICLVYVQQDSSGDRVFHSYVNPTPDEWLTENEIEKELFETGKIFYIGSGTLFHETARKTTEKALDYAKETNLLVAFDVNIRQKRWGCEEECRNTICSFLNRADLVKMTEEELLFLTESKVMDEAIIKISKFNIPYLFITKGSAGACVYYGGKELCVKGVEVQAIDTTGAGDAFLAALLFCFHEKGRPVTDVLMEEFIHFANQAGANATTRIGAL
ncbi:carbohydrate kinase [Bacillus sp. DTU_2020_1000418_1_SI_GHA_SEK_038]|uniref:carbohydrate kinase family protein n=1 Tax=Bacillus sp. DTU_2020_1000418_1_SI_GHA_SEK_038 TaxID=3077585 RepID=UPI0028E41452|nr:carbohydrate kinase [Bacillus sp. DTU_2020_1000418_1_SI_GHA_SEK_038]WNS73619.1 carbohydrate kinase [Bacillus sp. DTU_2020_1000418_1_SI_GHA_SEK_038]